MATTPKADVPLGHDDLFMNLAEQVKLPFVQIAHAAELLQRAQLQHGDEKWRQTIGVSAAAALRLIDSYLLHIDLQRVGQLELEPVSMSSVLYDAAAELQPFAAEHNCELELVIAGKYAPVMAHRRAVSAALMSMGQSFIEATSDQEHTNRPRVVLAVRRTAAGVSTGVFAPNQSLSAQMLRTARRFGGGMRQPLAGFESGAATGVFIADALLTQMETTMKVGRYKGLQGLSATFMPSRQLALV